jgi:hypothetical protein
VNGGCLQETAVLIIPGVVPASSMFLVRGDYFSRCDVYSPAGRGRGSAGGKKKLCFLDKGTCIMASNNVTGAVVHWMLLAPEFVK